MEESLSEDSIQEMLEELEEEQQSGQEPLSPDVEELLRELESGRYSYTRSKAARQLGRVDTSSPRIVQALLAARDANPLVREAAARAIRAPVHQECMQEHPDLAQRTQWAMQATEVHVRKKPADSWQIILVIAFGVVLIGIVAACGAIKLPWLSAFFALLGAPMLAMGLWSWLAASSARNVFLRSMKETVGTVKALRKSVSDSDYGSTTTYYVNVRFEAEDAKMGTRVMVLKAQVAHRLWKGLRRGESVRIQYAAEDPRIALIQGEW